MKRPPITKIGLILPVKDPPFRVIRAVFQRIASLPISDDAKIIIDGSSFLIKEKVQAITTGMGLAYLHFLGNKHMAIERGIQELKKQGKLDAVIVLDDDSLIDARWINIAVKLLDQNDMVWGFGLCEEQDYIAGFVNIDLNVMVALLDREYWLESGVYAFRLDAYQEVDGFGEEGVGTLSDDHALSVRFAQKKRTLEINSRLHHRLLNHRGLKDWFKQKIRWMGEILLISQRNVFLSLLAIPLAMTSPLLMWKASKITKLSFPVRSYFTAPIVFATYTLALLIAYRRIAGGKGIRWKDRFYRYNIQK